MGETALYTLLAVAGGLTLLAALASDILRRVVGPPLVLLVAGTLLGPAACGVVQLLPGVDAERVFLEITRVVLAVSLVGIALSVELSAMRGLWRSTLVVLLVLMPAMWGATSLLAWLAFGVPGLTALLVGAVVTPTDPVAASSVVEGRFAMENVPRAVRALLQLEAGANDGLAYLFVFLPVLLLQRAPGPAWRHWLTVVLFWEVLFAILAGVGLGLVVGIAARRAWRREWVERSSFLFLGGAMALMVLGLLRLLHTDGILGVFAAGVAFTVALTDEQRKALQEVEQATDSLLTLPAFFLVGMVLPWGAWADLGWRAVGFATGFLLLRRLPWILAARTLVPPLRGRGRAAWYGWFGPVGISAVFYAMLATRELGNPAVWHWASLAVFTSLLVHGLTAAPFTRWLGRADGAR